MIKLVIFDIAGTIVDHGCLSVFKAFREFCDEECIEVSDSEIRSHTGLGKDEHLRELCKDKYSADLYRKFLPKLRSKVAEHSKIIDGVLDVTEYLRNRKIKIGVTTGFDRSTMNMVLGSLKSQGFEPDCYICRDDVGIGRPSPWMIFRTMERLGIDRVNEVIKVGDTRADILAGKNAGIHSSIGVIKSSSILGLSEDEWRDSVAKSILINRAREEYIGADVIIGSIIEVIQYV